MKRDEMTSRKYGGKLGVTWIDSNLGFSCGSFVSLLKFLELSLSFDLFIVGSYSFLQDCCQNHM